MAARAPDFVIRAGDTEEPLRFTCKDANGVVDITGAALEFHMSKSVGVAAVVSGAAVITNGPAGEAEYQWAAGETTPLFGRYLGEVEVTFPGGEVRTFPNTEGGYIVIAVSRQLA